jgi:RNA polymerase sigma-70 factor, ECF subfamily
VSAGRPPDDRAAIEQAFRDDRSRVIAVLARAFGDLDLAEDATQEAFAEAAAVWPEAGVPRNPGAWLTTVGRRRAIDRIRRAATGEVKERLWWSGTGGSVADADLDDGAIDDDVLRLLFTCCHPALDGAAQVALALRLVAGVETVTIARAFLVSEATMTQRIVRAKRKIRAARIPFRLPEDHELTDRLAPVLAAIATVFDEGSMATAGDTVDRPDLTAEAVYLGRVLWRLMPDEPEVRGLLALMLLNVARRGARIDADGTLVPLPDQDRSLWDRELIAEGHALVRSCLRQGRPGQYQLHAAISAVHADAASADATEWGQIVALYDQLLVVTPTPVIRLNRAVAVAEVDGPRAALDLVDPLELDQFHLWHAVRADLLRRLGRTAPAAESCRRALELTRNPAERRLLEQRLVQLEAAD